MTSNTANSPPIIMTRIALDNVKKDELDMAKTPKGKTTRGKHSKGQSMWGGRFSATPGELMQAINVSIDFDKRLAAQDIRGSKAHSAMLAAQGIITKKDMRAIHKGLTEIEKEIAAGTFPWSRDLEDIHLNIENRLKDKIGDAAGRLHTCLLYTSPSPRDATLSRMPSSA